MKKQRIEQMLQDCLDGYEAGLTPEECLTAYNGDRAKLEPLLRQALSLRVAYANSPSEEFRLRTRNRLMFAAGREVSAALAGDPDPEFVSEARTRFLNAAGATAQEALRDIPPPRLAFWVNARRRLLEAAVSSRPQPSRRYALALRYGLSAAVVVFALTVATLAPFTGNSPRSADAELALLEQQIAHLEQQTSAGHVVSTSVLLNVTKKLNEIAGTLDEEPAPERATRLEGLHARSEVLKQAPLDQPQLAAATQAELDQAAEKLHQFSLAAAQQPTQTTLLIPSETAASATPSGSPTPGVTQTPGPTATVAPAQSGQVHKALVIEDETANLTWERITTSSVTFVVPSTWRLVNVGPDPRGVLSLNGDLILIQTDDQEPVFVAVSSLNGEVTALFQGVQVPLRFPGPDGDTIAPEVLASGFPESAVSLHHFVLSVTVLQPAAPTATP